MKDPFHKSSTFFTNPCPVHNAAAFPPCYFSYFDSTSITKDVLERPQMAQQTKLLGHAKMTSLLQNVYPYHLSVDMPQQKKAIHE